MEATPYLIDLSTRLGGGIARLPEPLRRQNADWLVARQRRDGGFGGRQGPSNLYYTGFALRLGQLLDVRSPDFWSSLTDYLRLKAPDPRDLPDALMRLMARPMLQIRGQTLWPAAVEAERVMQCRRILDACRGPTGYVRRPGGSMSIFQTFHAALCHELLGERPPQAERIGEALRQRQRPDGGFVDMPESADESGTNPTAAAVGALKSLGELDERTSTRAAGFLLAMQRPNGGFAAHDRSPVSDLMTTFTGIVTLGDCDALRRARLGDAARFVRALLAPDGGFLAVPGDDEADVEYTYYGVAALSLLAAEAAPEHPM